MRTLAILFIITAVPVLSKAQMSCCQSSTANANFAMLGEQASFRNMHAEPEAFVYDNPNGGEIINFSTPDGKEGIGWIIKNNEPTNDFVFVFHEWWGLNDWIKDQADKLYHDLQNVHVIAIDLYDGEMASTREAAASLMKDVDEERAKAIIEGAIDYAGADANIYTVGWCFGGGWSLQASILAGEQGEGCVMYYGMPETDVDQLEKLECDVLGLFATKDDWINRDVVENFRENMRKAGKSLEVHWFEADHAFANPSNPHYDREAKLEAYRRTIDFIREHL
jgi:carboxymethylenebutenolidase